MIYSMWKNKYIEIARFLFRNQADEFIISLSGKVGASLGRTITRQLQIDNFHLD
jgi:hypothetical protein